MKNLRTILLIVALATMGAGLVLAQSIEKKSAPKTDAKKEEPRTAKGNALKGRTLFEDQCAICHFPASSEKKIGPGLKAIFRNGKFSNGKKVDDASMRAWIENGGVDMPSFRDSLTAQQIVDLIAYLRTL
jgi:mono/diheme cytochrome c family protein